jgi:hypothetical protein
MDQSTFKSPASDDEDKPLDPVLLRVQARLRRLMLIAGLTLGLGLLAVFVAILYRISAIDTTAKPMTAATAIPIDLAAAGLPADAKLVSTALDGNRLSLTYDSAAGGEVVIVDLKAAVVVGRLTLKR